jgi:hypothetical protein
MTLAEDYWISVEKIDCIPRLIARLEQALGDPRRDYVPATVIYRTLQLALRVHFEEKEVPIPYEYQCKLRDFVNQLRRNMRYRRWRQ